MVRVVVVRGQAADQGDGVLAVVRKCWPPVLVIGIGQLGARAALPDDPQLRGRVSVGVDGDGDLVMTARMSCLRSRSVVVGASNTARTSAPAVVIQASSSFGERDRAAGALGGQVVLGAARTAASLSSSARSRVRATSRFSGSTSSNWRGARSAS